MKKIIKSLFLCLFFFLFVWNWISANILVENTFEDIESNYKYRDILQYLYDKEIIVPDSNWNLNPYLQATRDSFASISMEVSCKDCLYPNTDYEYVRSYWKKTDFFDVSNNNNNFYCIYLAQDEWYMDWYNESYECEDWTKEDQSKPFCISDSITKEKAISILLKSSWLFSEDDNNTVINGIANGTITQELSSDVSVKNADWSINSYYWYLKKALELELVEFDLSWEEVNYKMLSIENSKIRPKETINNEQLIYLSYIILKLNSCKAEMNNDLALAIDIYDTSCSPLDDSCSLSNLEYGKNAFDIASRVYSSCDSWIDSQTWYRWWFYNTQNGDIFTKEWSYIDDIGFTSKWIWQSNLSIIDKCGNESRAFSLIVNSGSWKNISTNIKTSSINSAKWSEITFEWIVWTWSNTVYNWGFWDGETWLWSEIKHIYQSSWLFKVELSVIEDSWYTWNSYVFINISDSEDCETDSDKDSVNNCLDKCPLFYWEEKNSWCPIYETICNSDCSCSTGYKCSTLDEETCSTQWICLSYDDREDSCYYDSKVNSIFWKAVCNASPCSSYIDFSSNLKSCDTIYPAIMSFDWNTVYWTWAIWKIK